MENAQPLPPLPPSIYALAVLSMPISRRQDWKKWDAEITRLEEKCRKLRVAITKLK